MGSRHLALVLVGLAACSTRRDPPPPSQATPPRPKPSAHVQALPDPRGWRASSAPCPLALVAPPRPRPGKTIGELALDQGHSAGQVNRRTVRAFSDATMAFGNGDDVPVIYVERKRREPVVAPGARAFVGGASEGTAYLFDRTKHAFVCMADVSAESSSAVTSFANDSSGKLWVSMDFELAIDRAVVESAHAIDPSSLGDAGAQ